jgi:hypothetical protein
MRKQPVLLGVVLIALVIVSGVWLYAQQARAPERTTIQSKPSVQSDSSTAPVATVFQTSTSTTTHTISTATTTSLPVGSHTIGQVTLSPNLVTAGASKPITLTATITDPDLIPSSVDAVYSRPGVTGTTILGTLHDDGLNGDIVAGDDIYTIVFTLPAYLAPGELDFQITAAFRGVLARTKTSLIPLYINSVVATTTWITLSDSQNLFIIAIPPGWNIHLVQTSQPDQFTLKSVQFAFPDGTVIFTIDVYTPTQWQEIASGGISPLLIGSSSQYYFGLEQAQAIYDTNGVSATTMLSELPQVYSTFAVR